MSLRQATSRRRRQRSPPRSPHCSPLPRPRGVHRRRADQSHVQLPLRRDRPVLEWPRRDHAGPCIPPWPNHRALDPELEPRPADASSWWSHPRSSGHSAGGASWAPGQGRVSERSRAHVTPALAGAVASRRNEEHPVPDLWGFGRSWRPGDPGPGADVRRRQRQGTLPAASSETHSCAAASMVLANEAASNCPGCTGVVPSLSVSVVRMVWAESFSAANTGSSPRAI